MAKKKVEVDVRVHGTQDIGGKQECGSPIPLTLDGRVGYPKAGRQVYIVVDNMGSQAVDTTILFPSSRTWRNSHLAAGDTWAVPLKVGPGNEARANIQVVRRSRLHPGWNPLSLIASFFWKMGGRKPETSKTIKFVPERDLR